MKKVAFIMLSGVFSTSLAFAAESGLYAGVGVGSADYDVNAADLDAELASVGIRSSSTVDKRDTAWKVFGGYQVNRNFAIEAGYVDLGAVNTDSRVTSPFSASTTAKTETNGLAVVGVGILPVTNRFSILGKAGVYVWETEAKATVVGPSFGVSGVSRSSASADGTDFTFGLGAKYDLTNNFSIRGEWDRYKLEDTDVNVLSLNAVVRF